VPVVLLLLLVVFGVALLALLLLPVSLWARYRNGRARRRAQGWAVRTNAWLLALSVPLFLASVWIASLWLPQALRDACYGLLAGVCLGIVGLWRGAKEWKDISIDLGFVLSNDRQLNALKKYCKKVYIDLEKGPDLPDRSQLLAGDLGGPPKPPPPLGPSVLTSIKQKVTYREQATVDEELPVARTAQRQTEVVLKDIMNNVEAGKALDAPRVQEAVTSMTDSVVRNPDPSLIEFGNHFKSSNSNK